MVTIIYDLTETPASIESVIQLEKLLREATGNWLSNNNQGDTEIVVKPVE